MNNTNYSKIIFENNIQNDIILNLLIFIISIITTIGGVGGGGLLIPTFLLLSDFNIQEIIPLSVATILGDTIVRVIYLQNKRHPLNNKRFLIDLSPLLLIIPFDGNLSFIGAILLNISSYNLTMILLIMLLTFTFYKSLTKAIKTFSKESKFKVIDDNNSFEVIIIDGIVEYIPKDDIFNTELGTGDSQINKIFKISICGICIIILSIFSFMRNNLNLCSSEYISNILIQFGIILFLSVLIIYYVYYDYNSKRNSDYIFLKGDIVWKKFNIVKFITTGSFTGILSTYMGIGGGMLTTPAMISAGMLPEVVVATSSISTFFSTIISLINYITLGQLLYSYAISFAISSAIGSLVGLKVSNYLLKKFKRQSIIIFFVSFILLVSIVLIIIHLSNEFDGNFNFKALCE
jgi:uncharacterized membrane protein YfcA